MAKNPTHLGNVIDLAGLLDSNGASDPSPRQSAESSDWTTVEGPSQPSLSSQTLWTAILIAGWTMLVLCVGLFDRGMAMFSPAFWFSSAGLALVTQIVLPFVVVLYLRPLGEQMRRLGQQADDVRTSIERMADPQPQASGKILSIRHAVHQELAKLNEQLDQSLNRTSEIEAVVKREVGVLESSFADNERRMLGLVQELARQRETLATATEQVQGVVKGSREALHEELANLASQVLEAGNYARGVVEEVNLELRSELSSQGTKFANTIRDVIDERVRPLGEMLTEQVQSVNDLLKSGSGGLVQTFEVQGQRLVSSLDAARGRLREDMEAQSRSVDEIATRLTGTISQSLDSSVNRIESQIGTASIELAGILDAGAQQASQRFIDATAQTMSDFDQRMSMFQQSADVEVRRLGELVEGAAMRLVPTLERHNTAMERTLELEGALSQTTDKLNDLLTTKAGQFADSMARNVRDFHLKISDQTKEISDGLVVKMDQAIDALDEGSKRFTSTLQNVQDTVAVASDKLSITVAEHNATVAQHVDQIESIFASGSDRLDEQLLQSVGALSATLEKGASSVEDAFVSNTARLADRLGDSLSAAEAAFQARFEAFQVSEAQNQERLQTAFDASIRSVAELIENGDETLTVAARQAKARMEAITERFSAALGEHWQKFSTDLSAFAERAREDLAQSGAQNVSSLEAKMAAVAGAMQDRVNAIYGNLDARTREFEANITQFGSNIDTQTSRLHRVISQKSEAFEQGMEQGIGRLDTTMSSHLERAVSALDQFLASEESTFDRQFSELSRLLGDQTQSLSVQFASSQNALELRAAKLASSVAQFDATIEQQVNRLDKQVAERSARLEQSLQTGIETIEGTLADHIERSEEQRVAFLKDGQISFDRQIEVLTRTLDSRSEVLDSIMRTRGADFTDQLHASSKQFEEELTETSRALETLFRQGSLGMEQVLTRQTEQVQAALEGVIEKSAATTDLRINDLDARLTTTTGRLSDALERRSDHLLGSLAARANLLEEALAAGTNKLDATLSRETSRLTERIGESSDALETQLREQVGVAASVLSEGGEKISRAVRAAAGEIESSVAEGVNGVRKSMDKSVEEASQLLTSGVEQTQRQLDAGLETLLVRLSQHEKKALSRMESAAANVGDTTRKAAELAADRLVTVNGALVQVLSALGTTRPSGRKAKPEVIADVAE